MGKSEQLRAAGELIRNRRWAALATVDKSGGPLGSMVAYVIEDDFGGILLHLSRLAEHTGNLISHGVASLVVSEIDEGSGDPQQLARVSISGQIETLPPEHAGYETARSRYLSRLPDAESRFEFPDFVLFRLVPERVRWVGGFANAFTLGGLELKNAARLSAY